MMTLYTSTASRTGQTQETYTLEKEAVGGNVPRDLATKSRWRLRCAAHTQQIKQNNIKQQSKKVHARLSKATLQEQHLYDNKNHDDISCYAPFGHVTKKSR
jgi:hypothetical protein